MNIVHIQHPFIPERGYQENYLPRRQSELGHDVSIITTDILPKKFEDQESQFTTGEYTYNGVRVFRNRSISYDTEAATLPLRVRSKIRELDPDIIHSHRMISFLSIPSLYSHFGSSSKLFFDLHIDNDNFHLNKFYKKWGFRTFKHLLLPILKRQSDGFLAANPFAERFLKNTLGVDKTYLLPLGVDSAEFYYSKEERSKTRSKLGIRDELLVITSGNITPSKKVENVIKAVSRLSGNSVQLLVLGDGPEEYMEQLRKLSHKLGMNDQVIFRGFVSHSSLSEFYNAADLGIWPGKLGVTIIEAIGCGLPIIVAESEATDFLVQNDNGFAVENISPEMIANYIERYLNEPSLAKEQKKNALGLTSNKLSWKSIAEQSIQIYKK